MLGDAAWHDLLERRATDPGAIAGLWRDRRRCPVPAEDGRLFLVAADHPARGAVAVGDRPLAMGDRRDLLDRLLTALGMPGVDGVLASADLADELLLLDALHDRVVVGTMNRGGLAGSCWELDDPMTGYDCEALVAQGLDGGKALLRIDLEDPGTRPTIEACARAVTDLAARDLMALIEPLPVGRDGAGRLTLLTDEPSLVRAVGVAAGLGASSARTWLKLPAVADPEPVLGATTLPVLLLGGAAVGEGGPFEAWRRALAMPNARGLVAGRALLYPPDDDVAGAVARAADLVHGT